MKLKGIPVQKNDTDNLKWFKKGELYDESKERFDLWSQIKGDKCLLCGSVTTREQDNNLQILKKISMSNTKNCQHIMRQVTRMGWDKMSTQWEEKFWQETLPQQITKYKI